MFSPGGHWVDYAAKATSPEGNKKHRANALRVSTSKQVQDAQREMCKEDILYFINTFVRQYDPTQSDPLLREGPFITWPFQERAIRLVLDCLEAQKPMVIPKSRKMGATWLILIIMVWLILFHDWFQCLCISKSALAVDDETGNSLFSKVKHILDNLPTWMVGESFRKRMFIGINRTHSELAGEASSKRSGVGGRGGFVMVDEAAEIEELDEVSGKLVRTAPFRVYISTHLGTGNPFYELCESEAYVVLQFHWTQHPECNKGLYSYDTEACKQRFWRYDEQTDQVEEIPGPVDECLEGYAYDQTGKPNGGPYPGIRSPWYDKMVAEMKNDERMAAMQLDINPTGSVSQFYNASVIRHLKAKHACEPFHECELEYDLETGVPVKLVHKPGGRVKLWCFLQDGKPLVSSYGAGADVGGGTGRTPSCLSITNGRIGEKVMEFQDSKMQAKEFATLAVALCRLFCDEDGNGALLVWEHHGPGAAFGQKVWEELGYLRVYLGIKEDTLGQKRSDKPGWNPTGPARLLLHTDYRAALWDGHFLNHSEQALDECLRFKHDGKGSVEHTQYVNKANPEISKENHGDVVIADALSHKMVKGQLLERIEEKKDDEFTDDLTCMMGRRNFHKRAEREREEAWS